MIINNVNIENISNITTGVRKVPYSPLLGKNLPSLLGKNIELWKEEGNIMAVGKNITWKKGKQDKFPIILRQLGIIIGV